VVLDHRASLDLAITWVQTLGALTGQRNGRALWLRLPVEEALRPAKGPPGEAWLTYPAFSLVSGGSGGI
jgi:hypothetical protein